MNICEEDLRFDNIIYLQLAYGALMVKICSQWVVLHKLGTSSQIFICLFCFQGDKSIFHMCNKWLMCNVHVFDNEYNQ